MRRSITISGDFILISLCLCCTMGILMTAFSFSASLSMLIPVLLLACSALSAVAVFFRGRGLLVLCIPMLVLSIWKLPEVLSGAKWAVSFITEQYNKWLYIPILFPSAQATQEDLTLFLSALGVVLAFLLTISISMKRSAFMVIVFTIPLVFLTVVLTETTPDFRFVIGLLAVYLTLIFSTSQYPDDYVKRGNGIYRAIALSLLLLLAAYLVAPPDGYKRSNLMNDIDNYLRNTVGRINLPIHRTGTGWPNIMSSVWQFDTDRVDIANAGSRIITDRSLLEITSSISGTFYLRGFSVQSFNGREWRTNSETHALLSEALSMAMPAYIVARHNAVFEQAAMTNSGTMTIKATGDATGIAYQPYYSAAPAYMENDIWTVHFYDAKTSVMGMLDAIPLDARNALLGGAAAYLANYGERVKASVYTQVDESTAAGLRQLAIDAGIDENADRAEIADLVAAYIASSAQYSLTPLVIPQGEDFALSFLQSAKRGYCIHFATAATLMLRSLGIPARFTSGYVVSVSEEAVGKTVTVTDREAHSWVEVYYDGVGWIPLEATPSGSVSGIPAGTNHYAALQTPNLAGTEEDENIEQSMETIEDAATVESAEEDMETRPPSAMPMTGEEAADIKAVADATNAPRGVVSIATIAGFGVIAPLAICLNRIIVRELRKRRFGQADTDAAILCAWRFVSSLSRHEKPPKELEDIALKARFSQHRAAEEERQLMLGKAEEYLRDLYGSRNMLKKFWLKLIRGV